MRSARLVALAAAVLLAMTAPARASTRAEIAGRVDRAIELAEAGASAPSEETMEGVRRALGLPDTLVEGGRTVRIAADPFLQGLAGASSADFEAALRHLRSLERTLELPSSPEVDEGTLRMQLGRAYAGPAEPEPSPMDRILQTIGSFLAWLTREAGSAVSGGPGLILLLVVVGAAVVLLIRRRAFSILPEAAAPGVRRTAPDWRRLADEARARGDLPEAVSCLYRAVVAELAARGLVQDRPSLTAREVRLATALEARLAEPIAEASRRYERIRYGGNDATRDDLSSLERAAGAAHRAG